MPPAPGRRKKAAAGSRSRRPKYRQRDGRTSCSALFQHRILALAAGMTYYTLFAIFPALAALVAIYGLFADTGTIAKHLDQVSGFIPSGAIEVAREQLTRVVSKGNQTLGLTSVIGLAISLWRANAAMKSLFDTLNIVYDEKEKRGSIKLNVMSLTFTIAAIAFVVAALGAIQARHLRAEAQGRSSWR
ncbi:MAG: rane protein [Acetobacteraceae bacterium]|nr:rane protein [Acetobacteraceae bacterium]